MYIELLPQQTSGIEDMYLLGEVNSSVNLNWAKMSGFVGIGKPRCACICFKYRAIDSCRIPQLSRESRFPHGAPKSCVVGSLALIIQLVRLHLDSLVPLRLSPVLFHWIVPCCEVFP